MTEVLCFGSCVLDLYAEGQKPAVGEDAANQVILLPKLGFSTACIARLGRDQEADLILNQLQLHHVDIRWLRQHESKIATHSLIQLDAQGERHFTVAGEAHRHFTLADFPLEALPSLRALSLGSLFTLHALETSGMEVIFRRARDLGLPIYSDTPRDRHHKGLSGVVLLLPYLDVFTPSLEEIRPLCSRIQPDEILRFGIKTVVLKMESNGANAYQVAQVWHCPGCPAQVLDTTGAGDSFCAGFTASSLRDLPIAQTLENGCWCGAQAVRILGANTSQLDPSHLPWPLR
mgnify:CR=1 FL=1